MKKLLTIYFFFFLLMFYSCTKEDDCVGINSFLSEGNIEAVIIDQNNDPVSEAFVIITPGDLKDTSDVNGIITTGLLEKGSYSMAISKENYADTVHSVNVLGGVTTKSNYRILILGSIKGTVTDPISETPVEGAEIITIPATGVFLTDAEGKYEIEFIQSGEYVVKVNNVNTIADNEKIIFVRNAVINKVNFGSLATGSVEGTVRDKNGMAVSGAIVNINPDAINLTTDANGYFLVEYIDPGEKTITLSKENYGDREYEETVEAGGFVSGNYQIDVKGSLRCTTLDVSGIPVAEAKIVINPGGEIFYTDNNGFLELLYLDEDAYTLEISKITIIPRHLFS